MTICILLLIGTTVQRPTPAGAAVKRPQREGVITAARKARGRIGCRCSTCNAPRYFDVRWDDGTTSDNCMRGDLVAVREAVVVPERLGLAA